MSCSLASHPSPAEEQGVRRRLVRFYEKYNPVQLNNIDAILFAYKGHWEELFAALAEKYGQEPSQPAITSSHPSAPITSGFIDTPHHEASESVNNTTAPDPSSSSSFMLLDPMAVVRERRGNLDGGVQQCVTAFVLREEEEDGGGSGGGINFPDARHTHCRRSLNIEEQCAVARRLKLQQMFLLFAPNEVLRMEEVLAQYREAYAVEAHRREGCCRDITDEEWQEAMIRDFLRESKTGGNNGAAGGDRRTWVPSSQMLSPVSASIHAEMADSPFDHHGGHDARLTGARVEPRNKKAAAATSPLSPFSSSSSSAAAAAAAVFVARARTKLQPQGVCPYDDDADDRNNMDGFVHSHVKPMADEWRAPPKGNYLADAAENLSTPRVGKLQPSSLVSFLADSELNVHEENEKEEDDGNAGSAKEEMISCSKVILRRSGCGHATQAAFMQTHEELEAESCLAHHVMQQALECPHFHYRLFLLLCCSPEHARYKSLSPVTSASSDVLKVRDLGIPYWESSLRDHVLWRAVPARKGCTFLLTDSYIAAEAPPGLLERLHAAWSLVRTVGLESLWCDEVTLADVVALRMRYFARRQVDIRHVVLRPFSRSCNPQGLSLGDAHREPHWCEDMTLEQLSFIDAVNELRNAFASYSEQDWGEFIQVWQSEHNLERVIAALQNQGNSHVTVGADILNVSLFHESMDDDSDDRVVMLDGGKQQPKGDSCMLYGWRMPPPVATLLSCAALLCLHVDQVFAGIAYVDVAATHHCLCVAAITEEEDYSRRAVARAWREEFAACQLLERQGVSNVSLQERECHQRDALEVQEEKSWLKIIRSVFSTGKMSAVLVTPAEVPSSRILTPLPPRHGVCLFSKNSDASATTATSSPSQSIAQWRREAVRRRVAAFFEREAERQRCFADRRQVEQVVSMLRAGKLSL